jgi:hypothetical protein
MIVMSHTIAHVNPFALAAFRLPWVIVDSLAISSPPHGCKGSCVLSLSPRVSSHIVAMVTLYTSFRNPRVVVGMAVGTCLSRLVASDVVITVNGEKKMDTKEMHDVKPHSC